MTRAAPLLAAAYGGYLLYAHLTGALYFYIHPVYIWPTVATGVALLALGGFAALGGPGDPARGRLAPVAAGLLAVPLALGFLLPPRPLGAVSASQRGVDVVSLGGGSEGRPAFTIGSRPEAYTIKDWVKAFQVDPEPARHAGQPVGVTGFVYRDPRLPGDWILVARFVVTCCAVDAQPVGLPVRGGAGLELGRWVLVEGAWEVAEAAGERRAVIAPRRVLPVPRPEQPYLY